MDLAVLACGFLPKEHQERMAMQADLVNAPRIGVDNNVYFQAAQVNLSPAAPSGESMYNGLKYHRDAISDCDWQRRQIWRRL